MGFFNWLKELVRGYCCFRSIFAPVELWRRYNSNIDLASAKSEALVNNTCKQKKIKSCNAKRGTTMKMPSRVIDLISKKTNCTCSTLFLLISKKQIKFARAARFFVFPLPLFCTTTTLFCTTKTSNFLVTHYFHGGIVVCAYPIFCLRCSCSLLFFTAAYFHLCWPLAFLIFSPPLWISMFFFQRIFNNSL